MWTNSTHGIDGKLGMVDGSVQQANQKAFVDALQTGDDNGSVHILPTHGEIVVSPKAVDSTPLTTRIFKLDPKTLNQGLQNVASDTFGAGGSGGGDKGSWSSYANVNIAGGGSGQRFELWGAALDLRRSGRSGSSGFAFSGRS